jgi:hypothetical protein
MLMIKNTSLLFSTFLFFIACNNNNSANDATVKNKYEQTKQSLEEVEKANPGHFLTVKGHDKKNLLGQTVVKGTIYNAAKVCTYKNMEIQLSFYSKTGVLLEQDKETIFETLPPGRSKNFKTKYFAPKGTDSVGIKVLEAASNN